MDSSYPCLSVSIRGYKYFDHRQDAAGDGDNGLDPFSGLPASEILT